MRLWHYKLIPYLPKSQLLAQWRELSSIFEKEDKHILINYIYNYNKGYLLSYTVDLLTAMHNRNITIGPYALLRAERYFDKCLSYPTNIPCLHFDEHNTRYLKQCFYNLQEKYDRDKRILTKIPTINY